METVIRFWWLWAILLTASAWYLWIVEVPLEKKRCFTLGIDEGTRLTVRMAGAILVVEIFSALTFTCFLGLVCKVLG